MATKKPQLRIVTPPASAKRDHAVAIGLGLLLLTLATYLQVSQFSFLNWDDTVYVTENAHVLRGLNWSNVVWAFTTPVAGNWHPLTMLSHMFDVQLFGLDAGRHHLVNLAMHMTATLLLFVALRGMTGATIRSAFVAALFAVHPLHVESVAWVAERKDVLSTMLAMTTVCAYAWYVRIPSWTRYGVVFLCYVLALLAKPMVVTLPVVLLLLDVWPLRRFTWSRVVIGEKVGLLLPAVAVAVATVVAQGSAVPDLGTLPFTARLTNALVGYGRYLGKTLWPTDLAAFYPMRAEPLWLVAGVTLLLLVVTAGALVTRRRWPFLFVGWSWFVLTLGPVSGVIQAGEQAIADRYMYFPLVGLAIAAVWGIHALATKRGVNNAVTVVVGLTIVVVTAGVARAQVGVWKDSETLWRHAIAVTDGNYRAYDKLGDALRDTGALAEAGDSYRHAITLAPPNSPRYLAILNNSLGIVSVRQGLGDVALTHFQESVRLNPSFSEAQSNVGAALATAGRLEEAATHYAEALALTPDSAEVHLGLAGIRLALGDTAAAGAHYRSALALQPDLASARVRLAQLLIADGRSDEAIVEMQRATQADRRQPTWHYALAVLLIEAGRTDEARRELQAALALQPDFAAAQQALASLR
jgi:tetratricopeptide (TPR) repeat protein